MGGAGRERKANGRLQNVEPVIGRRQAEVCHLKREVGAGRSLDAPDAVVAAVVVIVDVAG